MTIEKGLPELGRRIGPSPYLDTHSSVMILVPLWIPFVVCFIPVVLLRRVGFIQFSEGFCSICGYNLTGNVSGVCPECGKAIESPTETSP